MAAGARSSFESMPTRTYILLAALTGVAILVAFAVQVMGAR
jgi:hypothetical protein